jgi:hypothetical protein
MNARTRVLFAIALALLTVSLFAQPGPEHKKLDVMAGTWSSEIEFKGATPSKVSGTETCEWFANLHVICRAELTGAAGLYRSTRIVSWLPAVKQYASYTVDSLGYASLVLGTNSGDTWTFTSAGQGWKSRVTMKFSGKTSTSTAEYAGADGKWIATASGKSTRK